MSLKAFHLRSNMKSKCFQLLSRSALLWISKKILLIVLGHFLSLSFSKTNPSICAEFIFRCRISNTLEVVRLILLWNLEREVYTSSGVFSRIFLVSYLFNSILEFDRIEDYNNRRRNIAFFWNICGQSKIYNVSN